jgi:hypothetical protein
VLSKRLRPTDPSPTATAVRSSAAPEDLRQPNDATDHHPECRPDRALPTATADERNDLDLLDRFVGRGSPAPFPGSRSRPRRRRTGGDAGESRRAIV